MQNSFMHPTQFFYHKNVVVDVNKASSNAPKPFRFERMWLDDPDCIEVMRSSFEHFERRSPSYLLCRKLGYKRWNLKYWPVTLGNLTQDLAQINLKLQEVIQLGDWYTDPERVWLEEQSLVAEKKDT